MILSLQLSFAVFPLVQFVGERAKMGDFAVRGRLKWASWGGGGADRGLNAWLLFQTFAGWMG